jgi:hypothetical protein
MGYPGPSPQEHGEVRSMERAPTIEDPVRRDTVGKEDDEILWLRHRDLQGFQADIEARRDRLPHLLGGGQGASPAHSREQSTTKAGLCLIHLRRTIDDTEDGQAPRRVATPAPPPDQGSQASPQEAAAKHHGLQPPRR